MGKRKPRVELVQTIAPEKVRVSRKGKWIEVDLEGRTLRIELSKDFWKRKSSEVDHGSVTFDSFDYDPPSPMPSPPPPAPALEVATANNPMFVPVPTNLEPLGNRPEYVKHAKVTYHGQDYTASAPEGEIVVGAHFNCVERKLTATCAQPHA
jgi:hypothetical protein